MKFPKITREKISTVQVNLTATCNMACVHCHIESSPRRLESMSKQTALLLIEKIKQSEVKTVDMTGGAPEMNPHFRWLVKSLHQDKRHIIDRCNLTILFEPGYEDLAEFLAAHKVELVCSLPCYTFENVDQQRGNGTFDKSIKGLQLLNKLGYGKHKTGLTLNLMYNPNGAFLPPNSQKLEVDYKRELKKHFNIEFNSLYALTNMPIKRFDKWLKRHKKYDEYIKLLKENYNETTVKGLMCRHQVSVRWDGYLFDCDFNLALNMPIANAKKHLSEVDFNNFAIDQIAVGEHCFGCTLGAGSSCGGALT